MCKLAFLEDLIHRNSTHFIVEQKIENSTHQVIYALLNTISFPVQFVFHKVYLMLFDLCLSLLWLTSLLRIFLCIIFEMRIVVFIMEDITYWNTS